MLYLYTFCVFIGRHSKEDLLTVLKLLINSLEKYNKDNFELHVFTNLHIDNNKSYIKICDYFDKNENYFNDLWLNLSYNKINIYKYLYDTYNIDFVWIDLDTIVSTNIDYLSTIPIYFITIGGNLDTLHSPFINDINNEYKLPIYKFIQGNIWKLNIDLYYKLIETFKNILNSNLKLQWDIQDLFNYYIYFKINENLQENNIFIEGINYNLNAISGLCIWDVPNKHSHANMYGLNNLYYDNEILKSKFYPNKNIHFISFTFITLKQIINTQKFKELFTYT